MRHFFLPFFLLPYLLHGQTAVLPSIIPAPVEIQIAPGECRLDRAWRLKGTTKEELALVQLLGPELTGIRPATLIDSGEPLPISFRTIVFDTLVPAGYHTIQVSPEEIVVSSPSAEGLFLGSRTIVQLFESSSQAPSITCMVIVDYPRFAWRGMHLDVVRHFFPVAFVKQYIDLLARYKMNSFHWHLTDDQGWRIEIKKHPKLTSVGSKRKGSQVGPYGRLEYDSAPYGGFYTQEQIREVVAYAAARHISVVPEIEMPGHAMAALAAYPHLGCSGGPYEVQRGWGVFEDVFCAGNDTVFNVLEEVLSEVMDLFPGPYIHIGGDESPKDRWKVCPKCQARMKTNGLKDEHELQSYFIQRIEKYVNSKGRKIIGWDEILEGGLAPNATVMSWRGIEGGVAAARSGHDAVMSPGSHCYFDHYQGDPANEPLAIGGYTPLQKVYSYEPIPAELNADEAKHILGAQGNIWTEYILKPEHVEYMALPRMAALAEVLWTPKEKRNEADLIRRLESEFPRLDAMKVNYSKSLYQVEIVPKPSASPGTIDVHFKGSRDDMSIQMEHITEIVDTDAPDPRNDLQVRHTERVHGPLAISSTCTVEAWVQDSAGKEESRTMPHSKQHFVFNNATAQKITLSEQPEEQYSEGGAFTLVDGVIAQEKRVNTEWLGWRKGVSITVDLGSVQDINYIGIGAWNETHSWIQLPKVVEFSVSADGKTFTDLGMDLPTLTEIPLQYADHRPDGKAFAAKAGRHTYKTDKAGKARFVRINVQHIGNIPEGFAGAGNPAWLFLDEIDVH